MKTHYQDGASSFAGLVAVVMTLLFIGASIFGALSFVGKQDYKNNTDKKIDVAVVKAVKEAEAKKDAKFAEDEKSPVKNYQGPDTFGTVYFEYPKSYSGYVVKGSSSTPLDGSFYPNVVPGGDETVAYALRMQVLGSSYDSQLKQFDGDVKTGRATVKPFRAAKVPDILGARIDGALSGGKKTGSVILLPLRDKTIKIWTESKEFTPDFDKYVVPSISFVP